MVADGNRGVVQRLEAEGLDDVRFRLDGFPRADHLIVDYATTLDDPTAIAREALHAASIIWQEFPAPLAQILLQPRAAGMELPTYRATAEALRARYGASAEDRTLEVRRPRNRWLQDRR
jgi:hypothetical protein